MGGGGANSLDSPKTADNGDFDNSQNDADLGDDNLNNNDEKEDTITEYTYKTYDDYFTDYNITAETIIEEDLTGSGTATDPYVVHSTNGFLWLSNYTISGIDLTSKYLELACDVVLNDETFDENGTPSGGDGIVYNFRRIYNCSNLSFNGKGFKVRGLYYNDESGFNGGLFYAEGIGISSISNLSVDDFYVYGSGALYVFGKNVKVIENCHINKGYLYVKYDNISAFSYYSERISNCTSYANIFGRYYVAGFSLYPAGIIEKCANYGDIMGNYDVSGFCLTVQNNLTIKNCYNYGNIIGVDGGEKKGTTIAGFVANASVSNSKESCQVISCKNYGKISSIGQCGAIFAYASGNFLIYDCHNFGEIGQGEYGCGTFVGRVAADIGCQTTKAEIVGCSSVSILGAPFIGVISREKVQTIDNLIIVKNCYLTTQHSLTKNGIVAYFVGSGFELLIENIQTYIGGEQNVCGLINHMQEDAKLFVKNTLAFNNSNKKDFFVYNGIYGGDIEIQSLIVVNTNEYKSNSYFYGSDFSDFYVDWKTGKIGLKALDGVGFYQGKVTEDFLIDKGYVKKFI